MRRVCGNLPLIASTMALKLITGTTVAKTLLIQPRPLDFAILTWRFDGNWYHAIAAYNTGETEWPQPLPQQACNKLPIFHLKLRSRLAIMCEAAGGRAAAQT